MTQFMITATLFVMLFATGTYYITQIEYDCPNGYEVGDIIEHRLGTQGVITRCGNKFVMVDTSVGHYKWYKAILNENVEWSTK